MSPLDAAHGRRARAGRGRRSRRAESFALLAPLLLAAACGGGRDLKVGLQAGGEVVEAEGFATYDASDLPGTKERALAAAMKRAVEKVVGVFVDSRVRVEKATTVESRILANTKGYISRYDILDEQRQGSYYKTRIRALVLFRKVEEDLRELGLLDVDSVGNPRVAILLEEAVDRRDSGDTAAANALAEAMLGRGYTVVDRSAIAGAETQRMIEAIERGDTESVTDLGSRIGAEVVVTGKADARQLKTENLGGFVSYRANISVQATRSGTGQVLATVSEAASGMDVTADAAAARALRNAAEAAGSTLAGKLHDTLRSRAETTVEIRGLDDLDVLQEFRQNLSRMSGIDSVHLRSYEGGDAVLSIAARASPEEIAARIVKLNRPAVTVESVSQSTVSLRVRK